MDIFYNNEDFKKNVMKIKKDLKKYGNEQLFEIPKDFKIIRCNPDNFGSNIMFIQPPFKGGKYFETKEDKMLDKLCDKYGILKRTFTYCHLFPLEKISKNSIKEFKYWIHHFVDLVSPNIIIILGEEAELSFLKTKVLINENHGKEITEYNGIPVILTYPMDYYINNNNYEDVSYKQFIQNHDWKIIQTYYHKLIR